MQHTSFSACSLYVLIELLFFAAYENTKWTFKDSMKISCFQNAKLQRSIPKYIHYPDNKTEITFLITPKK